MIFNIPGFEQNFIIYYSSKLMLSNLSYPSATHIEQHNHIHTKKQIDKKHFSIKQYNILTLLSVYI